MRYRLLAGVLAVCLSAWGQVLSVSELAKFLKSSVQLKMADREVAGYLGKTRLKERLDDRTIEEFQGYGIGPKTVEALHALRDRTQQLMAAQPLMPDAKPRPIPPPTSLEQAAIITDVREYALNYSKTLPDFICTQVTRRFAARKPGTLHGGAATDDPSWQSLDTLQIRLSYFQQKEQYKVILVNNSVVNKDYEEVGGSKSFGDFGSMMREIFEPASEAHFEWDHWGTLRGQRVMAFAYRIAQDRSQYRITVDDGKLSVVTAYHGLVEVDPKTHAVMRVTSEAENVPEGFPVRHVKDVLDYDYTELSGHTFLLPIKARIDAGFSDVLQRIDEEFRLYRKYSAESEVKFDTEALDPLPEEKTKETPAIDCKDPKNAADARCKK
jgi:hypothetical protein